MCKIEMDRKERILNFATGHRKGGQKFTEEVNILVRTSLMYTRSLKQKGGVKWWLDGDLVYQRSAGLGVNSNGIECECELERESWGGGGGRMHVFVGRCWQLKTKHH